MPDATAPQTHQSDPFALHTFDRLVAAHERGALNDELSKELRAIVEAVRNHALDHHTDASATLTLKLKFDLTKGGIVQVKASVDKSLPKAPRAAAIYWANDKNLLTKRDPNQMEMPLRDVNARPAATVTV